MKPSLYPTLHPSHPRLSFGRLLIPQSLGTPSLCLPVYLPPIIPSKDSLMSFLPLLRPSYSPILYHTLSYYLLLIPLSSQHPYSMLFYPYEASYCCYLHVLPYHSFHPSLTPPHFTRKSFPLPPTLLPFPGLSMESRGGKKGKSEASLGKSVKHRGVSRRISVIKGKICYVEFPFWCNSFISVYSFSFNFYLIYLFTVGYVYLFIHYLKFFLKTLTVNFFFLSF